jgi:plasmid stability protein
MKNITITIDDETHRAARVRAAEMGTSVSALVKGYLQTLVNEGAVDAQPAFQGVREMPMPFTAAPPLEPLQPTKGPEGQPYFVNGKWTFTKDGKPRKPGSLRHLGPLPDDWDVWPDDILASFDAWPYNDPKFDPLPFDESQLPKK